MKWVMIAIVALVLSAGTVFYEGDLQAKVCDTVSNTACDVISERQKGFPFNAITQSGTADDIDASVLFVADQEYRIPGFLANYGFWFVVSAIGFLLFGKLRDMVGNVVLMAAGVAAALVYFGILVI